jgi:hypothetical protein
MGLPLYFDLRDVLYLVVQEIFGGELSIVDLLPLIIVLLVNVALAKDILSCLVGIGLRLASKLILIVVALALYIVSCLLSLQLLLFLPEPIEPLSLFYLFEPCLIKLLLFQLPLIEL